MTYQLDIEKIGPVSVAVYLRVCQVDISKEDLSIADTCILGLIECAFHAVGVIRRSCQCGRGCPSEVNVAARCGTLSLAIGAVTQSISSHRGALR